MLHFQEGFVANQNKKYGSAGILLGGVALLLALVHFWGGPFSPQPTLETFVSERAASLRQSALEGLKGQKSDASSAAISWDADRITQVVVAVLGGLAFILAVLSFTSHESKRMAGGAAVLGISALTFQFLAMYVMAVLVVILILGVLSSIGAG